MIQNRLFSAVLLLAGLAQASAALAAAPQVIINQGQTNACTVTPNTGTVFTLDSSGNVLVNGAYGQNCSIGSGGSGSPTFSFNPNPANLTIANSSLGSAGGTVNPNFVAYFANSCTGSVTVPSGCPAITGSWAGGTVCTKATNANNQTYCSPNSAAVTIPANPNTTSCSYTFQAVNCTNGSTSISTQTAAVIVAGTVSGGGACSVNDVGDLNQYGYTRQCSGSVASINRSLSPSWDNSYQSLMSGAWPGSVAQMGYGLQVTINANQYASFKFNTGSTAAGVQIQPNSSYGTLGLISVSTNPGDFFAGTALCVGSTLNISSLAGTQATCKLALNTDYYLNFSSASSFAPYGTTCTGSACTTGWTPYAYTK